MKNNTKTLTLIRHAKAEKGANDISDMDRPLKNKGEKHATRLALWLKEQNYRPDLVWSSPAVRTHMTARIILNTLGTPTSILRIRTSLYMADAEQILRMIHKTPEHTTHLMLVGHNPAIEELMNMLCAKDYEHVPPGTVCSIEFTNCSWNEVNTENGITRIFATPTMLK